MNYKNLCKKLIKQNRELKQENYDLGWEVDDYASRAHKAKLRAEDAEEREFREKREREFQDWQRENFS